MATRYVPAAYCADKKQIEEIISKTSEDEDLTLALITMIDHAYHCEDENYDGGLSFFDRLHWKLSFFFEISWTPEDLKTQVRNAPEEYMNVLKSILDEEKIDVYGL
jgi:hypothetical protein